MRLLGHRMYVISVSVDTLKNFENYLTLTKENVRRWIMNDFNFHSI